ncbi:MAG: HAD-IC family P-type ATPase, partial [Sphaerospermopsis sp.]|nr:HAD-IC family P-type ATPase [Sphaerospermopsis sp.]
MIQIIHSNVKGRARYKIDELYRSQSLKIYLERSLANYPEIISVAANVLTSNILVIFQPDVSYRKIAYFIDKSLSAYKDKAGFTDVKTLVKPTKKDKLTVSKYEQKTENWHLMTADNVLQSLNTSHISGLSNETANKHLNKYGKNLLSATVTRSQISMLIEQFKSLPVALLGVAAGISIFTGGIIDAVVILGVVGLNAAIGYVTESQSERIINSLKNRSEKSIWVIRDDKLQEIPTENVVLGDILVLKPGSYIAADARIIEVDNLTIDESALTGESVPVSKNPTLLHGEDVPLADRLNMIYKGTLVINGQGLAAVVATGKFTEMGKIQQLVSEATTTQTPLAKQLDQVGSQLVFISMGLCGLVFGMGVLRGYNLLAMLQSSISLAVAAVPEGLPTIATTTLALGIREMRKNNVLVRSLRAVEALGSVQTICLDKTGTITENQMLVVEIRTTTQKITIAEESLNPYSNDELLKLIHISVLCNQSEVTQQDNGEYGVTGSPTENALIYLAIRAGVDVIELRQKYELLETNLRSENRNVMSTIHRLDNDHKLIAVKGNPEEMINLCQWWMKNGQVVPLTPEDRRGMEMENHRLAAKALRVLGVGYG